LPIYLWQISTGKRWQIPARGLAISLSMIKPQAAMFIWLYFFWKERKNWKSFIWPLVITVIIIVPISLVGNPPLVLQWIDNIRNPSTDNIYFWSMNNFSLTSGYTLLGAIGILSIIGGILNLLSRKKMILWSENLTIASLLYASMAVSPYTSQQSLSSAMAFAPSWFSFFLQTIHLFLKISVPNYDYYISLVICLMVFLTISYYGWNKKKRSGEG